MTRVSDGFHDVDFIANVTTNASLVDAQQRIGALLGATADVGREVLQDPSAGFLHPEQTARRAPKAGVALSFVAPTIK